MDDATSAGAMARIAGANVPIISRFGRVTRRLRKLQYAVEHRLDAFVRPERPAGGTQRATLANAPALNAARLSDLMQVAQRTLDLQVGRERYVATQCAEAGAVMLPGGIWAEPNVTLTGRYFADGSARP